MKRTLVSPNAVALGAGLLLMCLCFAPLAAPSVRVVVDGVDGEPLQNILRLLGIQALADGGEVTEARVRRHHALAPREIRQALEPFGYYRVEVDGNLERTGEGWLARYAIAPGPQVPIATLELAVQGEAEDDPAFQELLRALPLRTGAPLHHPTYERAKRQLQQLAAERGYFDARLTRSEVRVDLDRYQAAVHLVLDSGPRYRFGEVRFESTVVREALLQDFVPFAPGDPYDSAQLLELNNGLLDSDYFAQVEVRPRTDHADGLTVPIEVQLTARERSRYSVGLGYGTDTGARASLGLERRYVNTRGHRFLAELQISEIRTGFRTRYDIPVRDPRTDRVFVQARYTEEEVDVSSSDAAEVAIGLEQRLGFWRQAFTLTYLQSDFTIGDQVGSSALLMPGARWERLKADDPVYPSHGSRVGLDVRGASEAVLSETSFLQARLFGKWVRRLGSDGRVLFRADVGSTWVDEFAALPPEVRFFAGGDVSVRGYGYNTLGPENADGDVIGGRHLVVGSIEYEHRLAPDWSGAVFYDIGNAVDAFGDDLESGVGVGVRWRSPVGWVRVDVAKPLDEDEDVRLHLRIGPDL